MKKLRWVLVIDGLLVLAHLMWGRQYVFFNLDLERNLPAVYSGIKLVAVGFFAGFLYFKFRTMKKARLLLPIAAMFTYLGVDEMLELHEKLADRLALNGLASLDWYTNHVFYWTLIFSPLIVFAVAFVVYVIKHLFPAGSSSRKYFTVGIACFISVIALEVAGGFLSDMPIGYYVMTLEETFEIFGATMFLAGVTSIKLVDA